MAKVDSIALIIQDQVLERLITDLLMMGCNNSEIFNNAVLDKNNPVGSIVVYCYIDNLTEIYSGSGVIADIRIDFQKEDYETAIEKVFNLLNEK